MVVAGAQRLAVKGDLAHRGLQVQRVVIGLAVHRQANVAHPGLDGAGLGTLQPSQVKIAHGNLGGKAAALHKAAGKVAHRDCGVEIFRFHRAADKVAHGQVQFDAVGGDGLIVVKLHIAHGGSDGEPFKVEGLCIRHGQNKLRFRLAAQIAVGRHFVADGQRFVLGVGDVEPLAVYVFTVQGDAGGARVNDDSQAAVINVQHGILRGDAVKGHVHCVRVVIIHRIGGTLGGGAAFLNVFTVGGLGGGVSVLRLLDSRDNESFGGVGNRTAAHAEKANQ